ncbi:MAG: hypothetical protein QM539_06420, partial [Alphaproteobacteria bacterium]|nr:hypothetical protein [Alphaproteobacteria bacterium]
MLFIITVFTWFIQYPEIIIANGKLVNTQSPKTVLAHTEGKLKKLMVFENDSVQKQQIIGYMETLVSELAIADLQSKLITLKKNLRNLKLDSVSFLFSNYFNTVMNSNMGEIQNSFETFMQAYNNFKDYLPSGFYMSKKSKILQDISRIKQLNEQLKTQKSFLEKDLVLSKENIKANESLLKDKIISAQDYRNEQSKLIAKQMSLPQIKLSIIQNDNACNEKHKEIDEIVHQEQLQLNNFMQSILTLQSTIALWE